ncbi:MAG: MBL fold metallo-hydrolase [Chloroflexi bacterium]|nr:MAG: MBL fold metallo-hydrolase [Chloroflexota bacterium]
MADSAGLSIGIDSSKTALTVADLYESISRPNEFLLLDVRNNEEYKLWRIEGKHTPETLHIFYGEFVEEEQAAAQKIPPGKEVVVVCAKGGASDYVAEILRDSYGISAYNLEGGMISWGNYYFFRQVVAQDTYQIYQIERVARGCLSYLLVSQGQAAVIDPGRHFDRYLDFIKEAGAELSLILDTHAHADHISGGSSLALNTGIPYHLHPYDAIHPFDLLPAEILYQPLVDGQEFQLGDLRIEVIHTPGHTLGQVNFLASDSEGKSYVFTGDNLFIESFGRPDLGGRGEAWAPLVYRTIFETFKARVTDEAQILPGHYAAQREANSNGAFMKSFSVLRKENSALQIDRKEEFVRYTLEHLPPAPSQYVQIKRVNLGLVVPDEQEASELELGKNICALSEAYGE